MKTIKYRINANFDDYKNQRINLKICCNEFSKKLVKAESVKRADLHKIKFISMLRHNIITWQMQIIHSENSDVVNIEYCPFCGAKLQSTIMQMNKTRKQSKTKENVINLMPKRDKKQKDKDYQKLFRILTRSDKE